MPVDITKEYEFLGILGQGSFGCVRKARHRKSGEVFAVKTFFEEYPTWKACLALKDVASQLHMMGVAKGFGFANGSFPHYITLYEVCRDVESKLHMVMELAEWDLAQMLEQYKKAKKYLSMAEVDSLMKQLCQALAFLHPHYFHRDIKPDNMVMNKEGTFMKLTDFGEARTTRSRPPYTDYCGTRWQVRPRCRAGGALCRIFLFSSICGGCRRARRRVAVCPGARAATLTRGGCAGLHPTVPTYGNRSAQPAGTGHPRCRSPTSG